MATTTQQQAQKAKKLTKNFKAFRKPYTDNKGVTWHFELEDGPKTPPELLKGPLGANLYQMVFSKNIKNPRKKWDKKPYMERNKLGGYEYIPWKGGLGGIKLDKLKLSAIDIESYLIDEKTPADVLNCIKELKDLCGIYSQNTGSGGFTGFCQGTTNTTKVCEPWIELLSKKWHASIYEDILKGKADLGEWTKRLPHLSEVQAIFKKYKLHTKKKKPIFKPGSNDAAADAHFKNTTIKQATEGMFKAFKDYKGNPPFEVIEKCMRLNRDYPEKEQSPMYVRTQLEKTIEYKERSTTPLEYLDTDNKIFPLGHYVLLTGMAGIGKSGFLITYLLQNGGRILIDFDGENIADTLTEYAKLNKTDKNLIEGWSFRELWKLDNYDRMESIIKEKKINTIILDTLIIEDRFSGSGDRLRDCLDGWQRLAEKHNLLVTNVRNWGKDTKKAYSEADMVNGFGEHSKRPRLVLSCFPVQHKAAAFSQLKELFKGDLAVPIEHMTLIKESKNNYGIKNNWLIAASLKTTKEYSRITPKDFLNLSTNAKIRQNVTDFKAFCTAKTATQLDKEDSRLELILAILAKKPLFKSELLEVLAKEYREKSKSNINKALARGKAGEKPLIIGGGQGPHTKKIEITAEGREKIGAPSSEGTLGT